MSNDDEDVVPLFPSREVEVVVTLTPERFFIESSVGEPLPLHDAERLVLAAVWAWYKAGGEGTVEDMLASLERGRR